MPLLNAGAGMNAWRQARDDILRQSVGYGGMTVPTYDAGVVYTPGEFNSNLPDPVVDPIETPEERRGREERERREQLALIDGSGHSYGNPDDYDRNPTLGKMAATLAFPLMPLSSLAYMKSQMSDLDTTAMGGIQTPEMTAYEDLQAFVDRNMTYDSFGEPTYGELGTEHSYGGLGQGLFDAQGNLYSDARYLGEQKAAAAAAKAAAEQAMQVTLTEDQAADQAAAREAWHQTAGLNYPSSAQQAAATQALGGSPGPPVGAPAIQAAFDPYGGPNDPAAQAVTAAGIEVADMLGGPGSTGSGTGTGAAVDVGIGSYGAPANYSGMDFGEGDGGDGGDGGKGAICSELRRQGYLDDYIWRADEEFVRSLAQCDPLVVPGYQAWARPLAARMRHSKYLTAVVRPVAMAWARHMAHQMGELKTGSAVGAAIMTLGVPICRGIGWWQRRRQGQWKLWRISRLKSSRV